MADIGRLEYLSGQLHQGAKKFSDAAQTLRQQAQRLDWSAQDLATGVDSWAGAGSKNFQAAWQGYHANTQKSATALDNTSQALTKLAQKIDDSVQKMRAAQAMQTGGFFLTAGLVVLDVVQLGLDPVTDAATVGAVGADVAMVGEADAAATAVVEADAEIGAELDQIVGEIENVSDAGDIPVVPGEEPGDINFDNSEPAVNGDGGMNGDGTGGNGNGGGGNGGGGGGSGGGGGDGGGDSGGDGGGGNDPPATTEESVSKKLNDYLLSPEHPVGGPKANWFKSALGFTRDNAGDLAKQIVFNQSDAVETGVTQYGTKYNQIISIEGVNGRTIDILFAWIRNNDGVVRLVTAIPAD
jgi:WXG100 family type VII secretion target